METGQGHANLLADQAYGGLRGRIVRLELVPGAPLREGDLMAELGLGRTPVREALKRLEHEDLVTVIPRQGTFVNSVEAVDLEQIAEVRTLLEGEAARLAAVRAQAGERTRALELAAELEGLTTGADERALMPVDERIHAFVARTAHNEYLASTLERYFTLSLRLWYVVLEQVPDLGHAVHELDGVLRAIADGDPERAERLSRAHVAGFADQVRGALSRPGSPSGSR